MPATTPFDERIAPSAGADEPAGISQLNRMAGKNGRLVMLGNNACRSQNCPAKPAIPNRRISIPMTNCRR